MEKIGTRKEFLSILKTLQSLKDYKNRDEELKEVAKL